MVRINEEPYLRAYAFLLFGVLPLLVSPWNNNVFYDVKLVFALVITAIMVCILFFSGRDRARATGYDFILFAYMGLAFLSTVFSMDIKVSLFGMKGLREGLLSILVYGGIFYIFSKRFSLKVFEYIFISAVIISVYGILQYYGIFPRFDTWDSGSWNGNLSTLGNRNFAGSYCVLLLPFSVWLYLKKGYKRYFVYSLFIFALLLASMTRSGWVAFAVSFPGLLFLEWKSNRARIRWILVMAAFLVVFGAMNLKRPSEDVSINEKAHTIVKDVRNIENDESGSGRIYIWKNLFPLIFENPFLGSGPDTFKLLYEKYGVKAGLQFEKAHNEYLQMGLTMGIPALAVYFVLVAAVLMRLAARRRKHALTNPLLCSIIGYLMQAFFNISVISAAPLYWALLGIAANAGAREDEMIAEALK